MIPNFYQDQDEGLTLGLCLSEIQKHYSIESAALPDFSYSRFDLLKYYTNFLNRKTIRISDTNTYVSFVEVEYRIPSKYGPRSRKNFQFYVFCFLEENYGHIIIRKETIGDKLNEFFSPVEIDFEDDSIFSKKFYVLAEQGNKAVKLINARFRNAMLKLTQDDILIEVLENTILIGNKKTVNSDDVLELVMLGYNLGGIKY